MRLPRQVLPYLNIRSAIVWFSALIVASAVHLLAPQFLTPGLLAWLAALATVVLLCDVLLIHRWRCRTYRYDVTADATRITHGRVFLREVSIPTRRTLGVESVQGPLLRAFGLVELRLITVVGSHPLGPVMRDEAERIDTTVTGTVGPGSHA